MRASTRLHPTVPFLPRHARRFHDYFVTHLPSSSLHPDSRSSIGGPSHKLPREESTPHASANDSSSRQPTAFPVAGRTHKPSQTRDMTVVRIPLRSAKHHFGAVCSRGTRPYNEDTFQAGTLEIPAFARKAPVSVTGRARRDDTADGAKDSKTGDPQVFYFGVFDGHGGTMCSEFLKNDLHTYFERAAQGFHLHSSLHEGSGCKEQTANDAENPSQTMSAHLVNAWKNTVGGYFRRFQPDFFSTGAGGRGEVLKPQVLRNGRLEADNDNNIPSDIQAVLSYAFLRADLDFITNHSAASPESDEDPDDEDASLGRHQHHAATSFIGGSTASTLLISTPTPTPFWHPATPLTLLTAHVGDTRILLCSTSCGSAIPLTPTHHPSNPVEAARLRRYAAAFTTDSFGEERFASGLANTRAIGDARAKRQGVSAEPDLKLVQLRPAEASFVVLVSDGVTATLSDEEIVDVVREGRTPEEGAREVVKLAEELAVGEIGGSDNATCLVVRLGGWERRSEGGGGGMRTRENREWRRREAADPRRGRT